MNKYEGLISHLNNYIFFKREIDFMLNEYEELIRKKLNEILNQTEDQSREIIQYLFGVQTELSVVKYKFNYNLTDFLNDFIYDFDRQDEESISYLIRKIKNN